MLKNQVNQGYEALKKVIDFYIKDNDIKYISSELAPSTFKGLTNYYNEFNQFLVYSGGDHGLLGQEYNIKFRAVHDYMHLTCNLTFKFEDEKRLSLLTQAEFANIAQNKLNIDNDSICYMIKVIDAEIKGQIEYYEKNKTYVADQTKFIYGYLKAV